MSDELLKLIPIGYQVHITSWENDGDHENTKTLSGLTLDAARFVQSFASLFGDGGEKYGSNLYTSFVEDSKVEEAFENLGNAYMEIVKDNRNGAIDFFETIGYGSPFFDEYGDDLQNLLSNLAHEFLGGSEDYLFRVFESIEVYYFPVEVEEVVL